MELRIVTRKSKLALAQTAIVKNLLLSKQPELKIEVIPISTEGDRILDQSLVKIGGKGLFIKELEHYLLNRTADIAVHSAKDMPAQLPEGLSIGAILQRSDARDVFVSNNYKTIAELPVGSIVGTSSLRRQAQILALRPDLDIKMLRGNVQTRINKLLNGEYDAIVLAAAGLLRLNLQEWLECPFDIKDMLPAVGQGALGIEYLTENSIVAEILQQIHDPLTAYCVAAERAMNRVLGGSCQAPIGGYAEIIAGKLQLHGMVSSPDGQNILKANASGTPETAQAVGANVAELLIDQGATAVIAAAKKIWE